MGALWNTKPKSRKMQGLPRAVLFRYAALFFGPRINVKLSQLSPQNGCRTHAIFYFLIEPDPLSGFGVDFLYFT